MRVDLPAPLSPIRPSTSPLPRRRLTSRSAVSAPNRLATCSTRSASPFADGPAGRGEVWVVCHQVLPARRSRDRYWLAIMETRIAIPSDQEEWCSALIADEVEAVLQLGQDQGAEQRADDRTGAAGQRGAADHRRGDGEEDQAGAAADVRVDRVDPERLEQPGEAAQGTRDHEVADLDAVCLDAGLGGADQVAADGDGVQAPPGLGEHHVEDRHDDQRPDEARPSCPGPAMTARCPWPPPGSAAGYASEMVSMMPWMAKKLPSVATNDGTRK